ncbi:hypothetical protein TWF730_011036 [Orbilia blumenaviensis]|uniref:Phosphatidate phosphatase APP1 catalytic domain-containing protein n=1 Tax=Orbilia blumenaviensis TaxID=1796055 RepID=A0AAV9UMF4_9PEZI
MYNNRLLQVVAIAALTSSVLANPIPLPREPVDKIPRGLPLVFDEVLLLDAPAFRTGEGNELTASIRMFTHVRQFDSSVVSGALTTAIEALGIEVGNKANNLFERTKLFLAIPRNGIEVNLDISGCDSFSIGDTANGGLLEKNAGIGACGGSLNQRTISGVAPGFFSNREFEATLFPSPPTGFGVISDVDDTIKISNVLDKKQAVKSLFIDDHQAVGGMPELYSKLDGELGNPAWFYLTGSPYQLFPSLRSFIFEKYPKGPMIVQNLTITDIQSIFKFVLDENNVRDYKIAQIEKLHGFYPQKKFLTVGDSTQADPEVYAEIARRHPDFIQCIWIRKVNEADNSDERFATAFKGVPQAKWKVFTEPSELMELDVASGKCN